MLKASNADLHEKLPKSLAHQTSGSRKKRTHIPKKPSSLFCNKKVLQTKKTEQMKFRSSTSKEKPKSWQSKRFYF